MREGTFGLDRRRIVPEILDGLSADDPRAVRSRGDLRRINWLMGNASVIASLVNRHAEPRAGARFVEFGAGDGRQSLRVARRLAKRWPNASLTLLDINPSVSDATRRRIEGLGWRVEVVARDVFGWAGQGSDQGSEQGGEPFDAAWANLVLHHFDDDALAELLKALARRAQVVVAAETRRTIPSLLAAWGTALIGANDVSRHDALVSVRAGFRDGDLTALWPATALEDGRRGPFTQAFAGRA